MAKKRRERGSVIDIYISKCQGRGNAALMLYGGQCAYELATGRLNDMRKLLIAVEKQLRNHQPFLVAAYAMAKQIIPEANRPKK